MIEKFGLHQLDMKNFAGERERSADEIFSGIDNFPKPSRVAIKPTVQREAIWIDARQDADSGADVPRPMRSTALGIAANVQSPYRAKQVRLAKRLIKEAIPDVRHLFNRARCYRDIQYDSAGRVVGKLMLRSSADVVALIGAEKPEGGQEGTLLHSLAVSASMIAFGRSLGLDEDAVGPLGFGGLLHDIGKMALSTKLLERSGPLNTAELMVIRTHPELGYEMLRQIEDIPKAVLNICLYHHERFDGSGYPYGLVGVEIPEVARIAAICDVYDALTSVRPYKTAWSPCEAIDAMLRSTGQFDPVLLDAFVSWVAREGLIQ
ncbi:MULTISPECIES: HD-GYP domain-containing protein [unclassified Rhizobium]|uniref:HD-GYP domain-containing protein n=1 Tax=unclassified Rhizobium TaxID=2613769 RepID=UPI000EB63FA3|nr:MULTISPECIES: HD-GYP domain-containing protein [unclassified Rhizobium]AYG70052.1 HD-GYP domain-containing protein [Rhizobium sp. CCGE531]